MRPNGGELSGMEWAGGQIVTAGPFRYSSPISPISPISPVGPVGPACRLDGQPAMTGLLVVRA